MSRAHLDALYAGNKWWQQRFPFYIICAALNAELYLRVCQILQIETAAEESTNSCTTHIYVPLLTMQTTYNVTRQSHGVFCVVFRLEMGASLRSSAKRQEAPQIANLLNSGPTKTKHNSGMCTVRCGHQSATDWNAPTFEGNMVENRDVRVAAFDLNTAAE